MKAFVRTLLCLVCVAGRVHGSGLPEPDSRLGAPFAKRTRAVLGAETAKVVVIEFSSFMCPHCREFHENVFPELRKRFVDPNRVQWVIINASNEAADRTSPVFLVARDALQKGKYWEVVDQLYAAGLRPPESLTPLLAKISAANGTSLDAILRNPSVREAVTADFSDYEKPGIRGTPTFLLRKQNRDGRWTRAILEDTQPLDYFQRVLDELLKDSGS